VVTVPVPGQDVGAIIFLASSALDTKCTEHVKVRPLAGGSKFSVNNACNNR